MKSAEDIYIDMRMQAKRTGGKEATPTIHFFINVDRKLFVCKTSNVKRDQSFPVVREILIGNAEASKGSSEIP